MIKQPSPRTSLTKFVVDLIGQPDWRLALGAFLMGLLGNVLAGMLGDWQLWFIPGSLIIVLLLAVAVVGLYLWHARRKRKVIIEMAERQPTGKAGVILLLSTIDPRARGTPAEVEERRQTVLLAVERIRNTPPPQLTALDFAPLTNTNLEPALRALEWHCRAGTLRECWLIGTPDEVGPDGKAQHGSAWLAPVVQRWFEFLHPNDKVRFNAVEPIPPRAYFQLWRKVEEIFQQSPYRSHNIICDITGGVKLMSVGAALACLAPGRTMQYMATDRDWKGEPIAKGKMEPVLVDINPYLA